MEITIIGAGLAGLSAAITLAEKNIACNLVSAQPSERAQSVLAEGGINAALNTMGEDDCPENHRADTMKAGVWLADPAAVQGLAETAPEIVRKLEGLGVPFNVKKEREWHLFHRKADAQPEEIILRNFGGQKKKRTAYARSSTGKIIMTAMIDEARKYEARGLIRRFSHHEFVQLLVHRGGQVCHGVRVRDAYTGEKTDFYGPVILACGGMNGMFPGMTTGTTANNGDAAAIAFSQGVRMGNLEMLQYHPTTLKIPGKRCLVTEAARGEGGRLYVLRDGKPWYFMEEKYPELGNLMPRDVVSREMYFVTHDGKEKSQVYLDMPGLLEETWKKKLPDLRQELIHYLNLDPKKAPIPVEPGIHYFMGGFEVDIRHRTSLENLYAAGECCMQYHGANRLGGNSMLGAIYGGQTAAKALSEELSEASGEEALPDFEILDETPVSAAFVRQLSEILLSALGIVRDEESLKAALRQVEALSGEKNRTERERQRLSLAEAMLKSAEIRKESRGAHYRSDYPKTEESYRKMTTAFRDGARVQVSFSETGKGEA